MSDETPRDQEEGAAWAFEASYKWDAGEGLLYRVVQCGGDEGAWFVDREVRRHDNGALVSLTTIGTAWTAEEAMKIAEADYGKQRPKQPPCGLKAGVPVPFKD